MSPDKGVWVDIYYEKQASSQQTYMSQNADIAPALKFGDWLVMLVISFIPLVNLIMLFIWAFDHHGNPNRRNFSLAMLLLIGIYCISMFFYFGYLAGMFYQLGSMFENI